VPELNEAQTRRDLIDPALARADRVRRLRRYARLMGEGYLQSVFLEMFGDPVENSRGWEITTLGDMLVIPPHIGTISPAQTTGEQICVRVGEVGGWYVDLDSCSYVSLMDVIWRDSPYCLAT
jgi:type I restriction enzyme S subunit